VDARRQRIIVYLGCLVLLVAGAWLLSARLTERVDSYAQCVSQGYPVTESDPPVCRAGHRNFTGPKVTPTPSAAPLTSVPFDILVDGDSLGRYPNQQLVIDTQADWQRYWSAVHASVSPLPPILPVDFRSQSVIALSEGQQRTGGYGLNVTSIMSGPQGTSVTVKEHIPTTGCTVTQAVSNRYFIVRTEKLTAPVSFHINKDYRKC
jgi:hypothetical protein